MSDKRDFILIRELIELLENFPEGDFVRFSDTNFIGDAVVVGWHYDPQEGCLNLELTDF